MDTMHYWALWRLLLIAAITFPFVVAAIVAGFLQGRTNDAEARAGDVNENASPAIAGPDAWRVRREGRVEFRTADGDAVDDKRAA